jgi:hypothetical protein
VFLVLLLRNFIVGFKTAMTNEQRAPSVLLADMTEF